MFQSVRLSITVAIIVLAVAVLGQLDSFFPPPPGKLLLFFYLYLYAALCMIFTILLTHRNSEQKNGLLTKLF